MLENN